MNNERFAGGLRCSEVLALLSDYVDGELDTATVASIEAHLGACDNCLRFGGSFQQMMAALSRSSAPLPEDVSQRLNKMLGEVLREE